MVHERHRLAGDGLESLKSAVEAADLRVSVSPFDTSAVPILAGPLYVTIDQEQAQPYDPTHGSTDTPRPSAIRLT